MEHDTAALNALAGIEGSPRECIRCHGSGEVVVASHPVGDGCFNDDFDRCGLCRGTGWLD